MRQQTLDHRERRGGRGDLQLPIAGELLILDRGRRRSQHGGRAFGLQQADDGVIALLLEEPRLRGERPIDQFAVQQRDLAGQVGRGQLVQRGSRDRRCGHIARGREGVRLHGQRLIPDGEGRGGAVPAGAGIGLFFHRPPQRGEDVPDVVRRAVVGRGADGSGADLDAQFFEVAGQGCGHGTSQGTRLLPESGCET